jgi:hypothetical protein
MKSHTGRFFAMVGVSLGLLMPFTMVFTDSPNLAVAGQSGCHWLPWKRTSPVSFPISPACSPAIFREAST